MKQQTSGKRSGKVHRKAADQVIQELWARGIRNDHYSEKRYQRGEQHAVDEDHKTGALQILQLGIGNLAVDLRQALFAAHGKQRMAQTDENSDDRDGWRERALEPTQRARSEPE